MIDLYFVATETLNGWELGTPMFTIITGLTWEMIEIKTEFVAEKFGKPVTLEVWPINGDDFTKTYGADYAEES